MQPDLSWMIPIQVMLDSLDHQEVQACSISSISDDLRKSNEDAYEPKVISVGPLHRGATRQMLLMEETKWRYMHDFLNRKGPKGETRTVDERLTHCSHEIMKLDKVISASYGGDIESEPQDLAKVMIVDGCFLLELLLRLGEYMVGNPTQGNSGRYSNDPIFVNEEKILSVLNDITMLENQIPFIVLKKLNRKVFPDGSEIKDDHRVANIVRRAFGYPMVNSPGGAHILHAMHLSTVDQNQQQGTACVKHAQQELLRCATKLRAIGIIIQPGDNTIQHKLVDTFNFEINFSGNVLKIPKLVIKETTEVKWRNLIAWEQSRTWIKCKYTSYALFFQGLICCKHDIEFLEEKGVIVNESNKSKDELLTLFRTIAKGVEHMDSSYSEQCESLNKYQEKKLQRI